MSTFTLGYEPPIESEEDLEISHVSGSILLSTRSAMDSFGLDDFKQGAVATLELDSHTVLSSNCNICTNAPVGIQLQGNVNITDLEAIESGGTGRVEGKLNITHLREYIQEDMISREWLTVDWDAAEYSSHSEVIIVHDPPKWMPQNRYQASFISIDENEESRSGPWLSVEELLGNALNVRGCLPDSFNCNGTNRQEINLTSTFSEVNPSIEINIPIEWVLFTGMSSTNETPVMNSALRGLLNVGEVAIQENIWCPISNEEITASKSWQIVEKGGVTIAPMSIWLDALGLPSSSFTPSDGVWSEVDFENTGCGSFSNEKGELLLGIVIY
ncbi:MAG: hypothetical protein OSB30_07670 [Candidatus Poseidoniaceae archaeon]|nr:hypothetical protein [Candidatus Poseidoniaceae archaeon]